VANELVQIGGKVKWLIGGFGKPGGSRRWQKYPQVVGCIDRNPFDEEFYGFQPLFWWTAGYRVRTDLVPTFVIDKTTVAKFAKNPVPALGTATGGLRSDMLPIWCTRGRCRVARWYPFWRHATRLRFRDRWSGWVRFGTRGRRGRTADKRPWFQSISSEWSNGGCVRVREDLMTPGAAREGAARGGRKPAVSVVGLEADAGP